MATTTKQDKKAQSKAIDTSKKVAKRSAKETRKAFRRFGSLMVDTTKGLLGVGQRRVNRRSNRTITGRYINDIISIAETAHLAGMVVDLSEILIEPRFLAAPEVIEPVAEDDVLQEVFYVIPRMPDLPSITAPYNLPSFRIPQLAVGSRKLAILGLAGSGRTTALMAIALWVMGELTFDEPDDPVKEMLAAEEAKLSDKERKELEQRREEMKRNAQEQLEIAIESGEVEVKQEPVNAAEAYEMEHGEEDPLPAFNTLLPIFVHLADLNITSTEFGEEVDPAEPLVRAVQRRVGTLTARTIPRVIYQRLEQNKTLILMDGYDDLPEVERRRVEAWLYAFDKQYGNNFIIMTGPAVGYAKLTELGMTPLFMKPWRKNDMDDCIDKWASVWPKITGTKRKPGTGVGNQQLKRVRQNNYALSPALLTLKIWSTFSSAGDPGDANIDMWMTTFIRKHLPENQSLDEAMSLLKIAATLQTDFGFVTRRNIEALIEAQEKSNSTLINTGILNKLDQDQDGIPDAEQGADAILVDDEEEDDEEDEAKIRRRRLISEFIFSGMLRSYRGNRLRFRHQLISDYIASLILTTLPEENPATLYELAQKPQWQRPFRFAVLHTTLDNVVRMRLMSHEDILHSNLIELGHWLAYVKEDTPWRNEILTRLGNTFVHPQQYLSNRERIAAVLVESRDANGAMRIFEVGLNSEIPDVRRLSCLGIGALGDYGKGLVKKLSNATEDSVQEVSLAAAHALAAINTTEAQEALAIAFLDGDERLQQAAAEEFAAMPLGGYMTLYEAVQHEELAIRRAALFGLRRVETEWAKEVIRQTFLMEDEWFVRVVAQESFLEDQAGLKGPTPPPTPDQIEWVQEWTYARQMVLPSGKRSYKTLTQTLEDSSIEIRALGAMALGQIGVVPAIKPLYGCLKDPEFIVREAAHKGLVELQIQMGEPLPDPL